MSHVLIVHVVDDYSAWKTIFDSAAGIRKEAGERHYQLFRDAHDPDRVVHLSTWTSVDDACRFFESPRLVQIRKEAGVHAPEFLYLESIEEGTL